MAATKDLLAADIPTEIKTWAREKAAVARYDSNKLWGKIGNDLAKTDKADLARQLLIKCIDKQRQKPYDPVRDVAGNSSS